MEERAKSVHNEYECTRRHVGFCVGDVILENALKGIKALEAKRILLFTYVHTQISKRSTPHTKKMPKKREKRESKRKAPRNHRLT